MCVWLCRIQRTQDFSQTPALFPISWHHNDLIQFKEQDLIVCWVRSVLQCVCMQVFILGEKLVFQTLIQKVYSINHLFIALLLYILWNLSTFTSSQIYNRWLGLVGEIIIPQSNLLTIIPICSAVLILEESII